MGVFDKLKFSRKEQLGLIIVWVVTIGVFTWFFLQEKNESLQLEPYSKSEKSLVDSLLLVSEVADKKQKSKWKKKYRSSNKKKVISAFDPNKLAKNDWVGLGFSEKQASAILKYKSRIRGFKSVEDLKSCFVINEYMYNKISGHVVFDEVDNIDSVYFQPNNYTKSYDNFNSNVEVLVNSSDASQFMKLKGIGPTLSERIVKFRDRLGGFYSTSQINEVYGVEDSIFNSFASQLILKSKDVKKIKINSLSYEELKSHPYIDWKTAKKIVNYREDWHKIKDEKTLLSESIFTKSQLDKILPYLNFD